MRDLLVNQISNEIIEKVNKFKDNASLMDIISLDDKQSEILLNSKEAKASNTTIHIELTGGRGKNEWPVRATIESKSKYRGLDIYQVYYFYLYKNTDEHIRVVNIINSFAWISKMTLENLSKLKDKIVSKTTFTVYYSYLDKPNIGFVVGIDTNTTTRNTRKQIIPDITIWFIGDSPIDSSGRIVDRLASHYLSLICLFSKIIIEGFIPDSIMEAINDIHEYAVNNKISFQITTSVIKIAETKEKNYYVWICKIGLNCIEVFLDGDMNELVGEELNRVRFIYKTANNNK